MTFAAAVLVAITAGAQAPVDPFRALDVWVDAIEQHRAGQNDEAVAAMLRLRTADLEAALPYMVLAISETYSRDELRRGDLLLDETFDKAARTITPAVAERKRLQALAGRIQAHGGRERFFKRAALLHADIGIIVPDAHLTMSAGAATLLHDGTRHGRKGRSWHWMLGRAFLHTVKDRGSDGQVLAWYRTAAALLWSRRNFVEAAPLLRDGRTIFPRDAELLFLEGVIHEVNAAPHIQHALGTDGEMRTEVVEGRIVMTRYSPVVRSAERERQLAEEAFRKALAIDPAHAEARIRHARLLVLKGRTEEAVADLQRALRETDHRTLRYWASLVLGRAEEARGRVAEATTAYEAASVLYPRAQSPRLALSQIAARTGDRQAAAAFVHGLSSAPADDSDPWWDYYVLRAPDIDSWLRRMWDAFAGGV